MRFCAAQRAAAPKKRPLTSVPKTEAPMAQAKLQEQSRKDPLPNPKVAQESEMLDSEGKVPKLRRMSGPAVFSSEEKVSCVWPALVSVKLPATQVVADLVLLRLMQTIETTMQPFATSIAMQSWRGTS